MKLGRTSTGTHVPAYPHRLCRAVSCLPFNEACMRVPYTVQMLEYMSRLAMAGIQETEHTRVNKPYTTVSINCKSQDIAYELFAGQGTLVTHNKRCIIRTFTTEEMLRWLPLPEEVEIEVRVGSDVWGGHCTGCPSQRMFRPRCVWGGVGV